MAIDLTSNIISRWKLDDTSGTIVKDSEGNHNGTTVADISTITSTSAPSGRSRSFDINDNGDKAIKVNDSADFTFSDGVDDSPFSFSVWVFGDRDTTIGTLISKYNNLDHREYYIDKTAAHVWVGLYDETNNAYSTAIFSLSAFYTLSYNGSTFKWRFFTITYDGRGGADAFQGIRFYVDGIEVPRFFHVYSTSYDCMRNTDADLVIGDRDTDLNTFNRNLVDLIVFDKALTDGEVRYLYNDGYGTSDFVSIDTINSPTLVYPNGGETFTEGDINIQWVEPGDLSSTELTWYEIFITDNFNNTKKQELIQIATVPSNNTFYSYTIQKNFRGEKCRVGIRSVNNRGLRSNMSFSAGDFIIINERLPSPVLMEPIEGNTYFSYVPFIFDHKGVMGRSSQRSFYQIYYKSDNQDIDWTLLKSNIMVGTDPVNIDVSNFNSNSDYVFKIELVDGDNISAPVFISKVNINNINFFLIDTTPPVGSIQIVDNEEYTKNTGLIVKISASDETSAVKDVQIQQTNTVTGETNNLEQSPFISLTPLLSWDIKPEGDSKEVVDGVKLIQARFRDYGGNTIQSGDRKYFRTYNNLNNREVEVILYGTIGAESNLYYVFASDLTTGALAELYKDLTFISTLSGDATSLKIYNDVLYVAIKDDENKGILQRLTSTVDTVIDNEEQYLDTAETVVNSLYSADSVINTMEVFDNTLFLGLDNGELLSFKGSSVILENNDYANLKSITNIKTDGIMLYIYFNNFTEILIMNKDSDGNYIFSLVDTETE